MTSRRQRPCIDCTAEVPAGTDPVAARRLAARRPIAGPGPRCATHWRTEQKRRRHRARERRVSTTYGITGAEATAILAAQGGRCAICWRATGKTKNLSVDHDHTCCSGPISCGRCVRGLLCSPCNRMLGHLRDDPAAFARAIDYLRRPPARAVLTTSEARP